MALPDSLIRTQMGIYVLRDDLYLSRWIEHEGRLDIRKNLDDVKQVAHLIPAGGVVVEAGACLGDHTVLYSQLVGADGMVYAFEPNPFAFDALLLNCKRLSNVRCGEMALIEHEPNSVVFWNPESNAGGSWVSDHVCETAGFPVSGCALDILPLARFDFLHLDAEGYETKILRGAEHLIARFSPAMLIEVCYKHLRRAGSSETELLELIRSYGYTWQRLKGRSDPNEYDIICTKDGR